jgi:hypothetical protein
MTSVVLELECPASQAILHGDARFGHDRDERMPQLPWREDGQPNLPSGGHAELPSGGQRDYFV